MTETPSVAESPASIDPDFPNGPPPSEASLKFSAVGLSPILQRAVADQGYTTMTPIQAKAIPLVLAGREIGRASCRERVFVGV